MKSLKYPFIMAVFLGLSLSSEQVLSQSDAKNLQSEKTSTQKRSVTKSHFYRVHLEYDFNKKSLKTIDKQVLLGAVNDENEFGDVKLEIIGDCQKVIDSYLSYSPVFDFEINGIEYQRMNKPLYMFVDIPSIYKENKVRVKSRIIENKSLAFYIKDVKIRDGNNPNLGWSSLNK